MSKQIVQKYLDAKGSEEFSTIKELCKELTWQISLSEELMDRYEEVLGAYERLEKSFKLEQKEKYNLQQEYVAPWTENKNRKLELIGSK